MCDVMVQSNSVHSGKVRMTSSIIIFSFLPSLPSSLLPCQVHRKALEGGPCMRFFYFIF